MKENEGKKLQNWLDNRNLSADDLAQKTGVTRQTVYYHLKQEVIADSFKMKLLKSKVDVFDKPLDKSRKFDMVEDRSGIYTTEVPVNLPSVDIKTKILPVFDIYGHAGRTSLVNTMEEVPIIAYVQVPGYEDCLGWVRVKGDCMAPFLKNGDYVALKKADKDNIAWGRAYFIIFGGENPLENEVKYIRKGKDKAHWILRSHDEEKYEDQDILIELVKAVYRVRGGIIDI